VKSKAWWVLGWVALTAIVVAAVRTMDVRGTLEALGTADPAWVAFALLTSAVVLPLATTQWAVLLPRGASVPWRTMFSIVALTASVSNGGPPFAGVAVGLQLLATRGGLGHAGATSVTILDQLAEGFAKIALIAAAAALVPGFEYRTVSLALVLGVPALALAFLALAHRSARLEEWASGASGTSGRVFRFLSRMVHQLDALRRPAHFGLAVGLAVSKKAIEGLAIAMVAAAFGLALPLWVVLSVLVAVNLSAMVAPTPAALGVWEASAFLVLRAAGVEAEPALAFALVAHAANLAPLALTGWSLESARLGMGARGRILGLAALAAVGLAIHIWFVLCADALDSDQALVLLMARDFARGAWSVYLWQQNYMAAVEPLLLTPFAALGWATPVAAGLVALALTAALAALSIRVAGRLGGATWMALLVWAVSPAVVVHHHVSLYGARLACTLLAVGAFAWSLRCHTTRGWAGVGALVGLAYFGDHLMLPWAAAVMFVAGRRGGLKPVAFGALVPVVLDTVSAMATPAIHLAGPNAVGSWLRNVPLLFGTALPQLFGLLLSRAPRPYFEAPAPVIPEGVLWLVPVLLGTTALVLLGLTLARHRAWLLGPESPERGLVTRALVLACLVAFGLFGFVGGGGDTWTVRYLVPLWPAVSILAAFAVSRWRPRLRALGAAAMLPAAFTLVADGSWPRREDGAAARAEGAAVSRAVRESGAQAVWAEYWDAYRMSVLAGDSPPWLTLRGIERRPGRVLEIGAAGPAAYLVRRADRDALNGLRLQESQGIRRVEDRDVGRFRLVVMEHAVRDLTPTIPAGRAWQMLAALSAALLFAGTLAGVALLVAFQRTRP